MSTALPIPALAAARHAVRPRRPVWLDGERVGSVAEAHLPLLAGLGCWIALGASRKRFIGVATGVVEPAARLHGSLAAALHAASQGARILRVHDVAATVHALRVWRAAAEG